MCGTVVRIQSSNHKIPNKYLFYGFKVSIRCQAGKYVFKKFLQTKLKKKFTDSPAWRYEGPVPVISISVGLNAAH